MLQSQSLFNGLQATLLELNDSLHKKMFFFQLKLLPSTLLKMLVNLVDLELEFNNLNDLHFENKPKKIKVLL